MSEIRYLVAIQKIEDGDPPSGTFISSARAISDHQSLLFGWITGKTFLVNNEMILSAGRMSVLFGTDAERDFTQMLAQSIGSKTQLRVAVRSITYDGPQVYRSGPTLDVLCKASSALPNTGGGYIFNFIGLRETKNSTSILPDITFLPRTGGFQGFHARMHKRGM